MKFEEAYCLHLKKTLTIEIISLLYKLDPEKFIKWYKDDLYCPECKEAKLSYNNAAVPYFKAYPRANHCEYCSLKQEEMSPKETQKYIDSEEGKERAIRNIESLMARLLDTSVGPNFNKNHIQTHVEHKTDNLPTIMSKSKLKKRFPQKRIDTALSEEDFGAYKLFYGTVSACWERDIKSDDFKLILRNRSNGKFLCRIKITNSVYSHLDSSYKFKGFHNCIIIFLASLRKSKNTVYTSLNWSDYLKIHFE